MRCTGSARQKMTNACEAFHIKGTIEPYVVLNRGARFDVFFWADGRSMQR